MTGLTLQEIKMSCNYAEGLSPYENKGKCGMPEKFDSLETVQKKVEKLSDMVKTAGHVVFHTGAGVSTSAGIPDFRGPNGVWTLEKKGLKPDINVSWDDAKPTITHRALACLQEAGYVQYVITQNIDGLHLKSGLPRSKMSELHGNMFIHQCNYCKRQFVRGSAVSTVGEKCLDIPCPGTGKAGRGCRGKLHDIILDWEGSLPEQDLALAEMHSEVADLSICLGTTLQILPSGNLPTWAKKHGGKLVICNLQPTKHDKKGDLIINTYVDDIMAQLCKRLGIEIEEYDEEKDPTKCVASSGKLIEWTIPSSSLKDACLKNKVKEIKVKVKEARQSVKRPREASNHSGKRVKAQKSVFADRNISSVPLSELVVDGVIPRHTEATNGTTEPGEGLQSQTEQQSDGASLLPEPVDGTDEAHQTREECAERGNGVSEDSGSVVGPLSDHVIRCGGESEG